MPLRPPHRTCQATRIAVVGGLALLFSGCTDANDQKPPPVDEQGHATPGNNTAGGDDDDLPDTSGGGDDDDGSNCGSILCKGHSKCVLTDDGAECVCDRGYYLDTIEQDCLRDDSCIQLRPLLDFCRQAVNGAPAVAVYFSVDYCSGDPIPPAGLETLGARFVVLENDNDVTENVESHATAIDKDVESYVALVLDVSRSFTSEADANELALVIPELQKFVGALRPEAGSAPVYVGLYVFGRGVAEFTRFTPNIERVVSDLARIQADPEVASSLVGGDGSSLYAAVERAIQETERIRQFRGAVSSDGILTTGAVVVVTDGRDGSGGELDTALINSTLNNVISIGIGYGIDDGYLDPIGRDGSYLAPTPQDWVAAFAEITDRVNKYPDRAYLLGYCSSAVVGEQQVHVGLAADDLELEQTWAGCSYSASLFGADPAPLCNKAFFEGDECAAVDCGGMSACGGCADDACCAAGRCGAPTPQHDLCDGDDQLCDNVGLICLPSEESSVEDSCQAGLPLGSECDRYNRCTLQQSFCLTPEDADVGVCVEAMLEGRPCELHEQCISLRCEQSKPDNPLDPRICQPGEPGSRMFQLCSEDGECETGTYCSTVCEPRQRYWPSPCQRAAECHYGGCYEWESKKHCGGNECFYDWASKFPQ
ncbi:MAG: vWA domain-containing protein [Nannocystaceae bacterium]